MDSTLQVINTALIAVFSVGTAWMVGRAGVRCVSMVRRGVAPTRAIALLTVVLIGLGVCVGSALGGGFMSLRLISSTPMTAPVALLAQLVGGGLVSWVASRVFRKWLAPQLLLWFAGEEDQQSG